MSGLATPCSGKTRYRSCAVKIVHITDTHLSPVKTHFNANWEPLVRWIEGEKPDLVVHTGDLTIDGADFEDDIVAARDMLRQLSMPVLVVPGNHDVGHFHGSAQPVNSERLERWRRFVGPDYWVHDADSWRIIGLNSLLLGLGGEEEEAQERWLNDVLDERGGRRVALFTHKPLFVDEAHEPEAGYWSIPFDVRMRLFDRLAKHDVRLVGSGHLHWSWIGQHENTKLVWAPPSSFILGDMEREMPGDRMVGAAIHELGDAVESVLVSVDGLKPYCLDDVVAEVYPSAVKKKEAAE